MMVRACCVAAGLLSSWSYKLVASVALTNWNKADYIRTALF